MRRARHALLHPELVDTRSLPVQVRGAGPVEVRQAEGPADSARGAGRCCTAAYRQAAYRQSGDAVPGQRQGVLLPTSGLVAVAIGTHQPGLGFRQYMHQAPGPGMSDPSAVGAGPAVHGLGSCGNEGGNRRDRGAPGSAEVPRPGSRYGHIPHAHRTIPAVRPGQRNRRMLPGPAPGGETFLFISRAEGSAKWSGSWPDSIS